MQTNEPQTPSQSGGELQVVSPPDANQLQPVQGTSELQIGQLVQALVKSGVTTESAGALGKMLDVWERMEARRAQADFQRDFLALQAELPKIIPKKIVENRDGTVRYRYAPIEDIDAAVRPLCLRHGFSYTFTEPAERATDCVTVVCILSHRSGHSRETRATIRVPRSTPGVSDAQADVAARSYARRVALCDALNIMITKDAYPDPRLENLGKPVTPAQAAELDQLVRQARADRDAFLRWAGARLDAADPFLTIPAARFDECVAQLQRKLNANKPK